MPADLNTCVLFCDWHMPDFLPELRIDYEAYFEGVRRTGERQRTEPPDGGREPAPRPRADDPPGGLGRHRRHALGLGELGPLGQQLLAPGVVLARGAGQRQRQYTR